MGRLIKVAPELSDNRFQSPEELSIYVSLEATTKRNSVITNENGNNVVSSRNSTILNFNSGNNVGGNNFLTTRYTDANLSFTNGNGEDYETLGISSIDIDFNSHLTPMFNIEFIDIKGATLLQQGENSKYAAFFQFPYPVFTLTIKGFYGKPVTYCLHLTDFKSRFDSKTGNFIISTQFIGYTYAILSDLLIGYLRAVPYTTKGSELFKLLKENNPNSIDINDFLSKVAKVNGIISEFKQSNENLPTVENSDEYSTKLSDLSNLINNVYDNISKNYGVNGKKYEDGVLVRFLSLKEEQKNALGTQLTLVINKIKEFNDSEFIKNNPQLSINNSFLNIETYRSVIDDGKTINIEVEDVNPILQFYGILDGKEKKEYYLFYSFRNLENEISTLRNKIPKIKSDAVINATTELQTQVESTLGVPVTIRSLTSILTDSADIFLKTLKAVGDEANSDQSGSRSNIINSSGLKKERKNDQIFAFPEYRVIDNKGAYKEAWIGRDYPDLIEVKFIEELLDGLVKSKTLDQQIQDSILNGDQNGNTNGEIDFIPLNILESPIMGNKSVWDYAIESNQLNSPESVVRLIILRALTLLAFSINESEDRKIDNIELSLIARLDALKASMSIKDQNLKKALIQNYMSEGDFGKKILDIAYHGGDSNDLQLNINQKFIKKPYVTQYLTNKEVNDKGGLINYKNFKFIKVQNNQIVYSDGQNIPITDVLVLNEINSLKALFANNLNNVVKEFNKRINDSKKENYGDKSNNNKLEYSFIESDGKKYIPINKKFDGSEYFDSNGNLIKISDSKTLSNYRLYPNLQDDNVIYLKIIDTSEYNRFLNSKLTYNYDLVLSDEQQLKDKVLSSYNYDATKEFFLNDFDYKKKSNIDGLYSKTDNSPSPNFNSDRTIISLKNNKKFIQHHFTSNSEKEELYESYLLFYLSQSSELYYDTDYRPLFICSNHVLNTKLNGLLGTVRQSGWYRSRGSTLATSYGEIFKQEDTKSKFSLAYALKSASENPLIHKDYTIMSFPIYYKDKYLHFFDPRNELYYKQKNEYNKALLFLHSLPFTGMGRGIDGDSFDAINLSYQFDLTGAYTDDQSELPINRIGLLRNRMIKRLFSKQATSVMVPYSWLLFLGGLLYRYENKGNNDIIFNSSNSETYNYDEYLLNPINRTSILVNKFPEHGITLDVVNNGSGIVSVKIENEIINLPSNVKKLLINEFKSWVDSSNDLVDNFNGEMISWKYIKNNLEIKSNYHLINGIVNKFRLGKESEVITNDPTFIKNYGYCANEDIAYELRPETELQYNLFNFLRGTKVLSTTYPIFDYLFPNDITTQNGFNNSNIVDDGYINDPKINSTIKKYARKPFNRDSFEFFIQRFIKGFLLAEGVMTPNVNNTSNSNPNSQQDINAQILSDLQATIKDDNIKLSIYRNIKSIYDKWVSGNDSGDFFTNCGNGGYNRINELSSNKRGGNSVNLIDHFKFVDRAMNDIGDEFLVNPLAYAKDVIQDLNKSFYDVINRMLADNYFNFIALPNFVNYNDENEMKNIFTAFPYDRIEDNLSNGPSFVCVYAGQSSINLNSQFSEYEDDGIDFEFQDSIPSDFTTEDDSQEINPMVFVVNYGIQNQSFFKDIELDQSEFSETDEGLQIIDDIAQNGARSSRTYVGQNLFNIYKTRSYSCDVTMMGNAMIQPFMYFQLNNIPLFKGGYLITRVSHNISVNTMSTRFKGVRIKAVKTPLISSETLFMNLLGSASDFSNLSSSVNAVNVGEVGKRVGNGVSFSINKGSQGMGQITTIKGRTDLFDINVHFKDYIVDNLADKSKYPNINSSQMMGVNAKNKDEACTYVLASINGGEQYGIGRRMDEISKKYKDIVGSSLFITHANSKYGGKSYFTHGSINGKDAHGSHRDGTCLDIGIRVNQETQAKAFIKLLLDTFGHYSIDGGSESTIRLHDIIIGDTPSNNKYLRDFLQTTDNGKYAKYVPTIRALANHDSHFHIQFTIPPSIQKVLKCDPLGENLVKPQSNEFSSGKKASEKLASYKLVDNGKRLSKEEVASLINTVFVGLSKAGKAGIMGNIIQESNFYPTIMGVNCFGLFQFCTFGALPNYDKFCKSRNLVREDPKNQMLYVFNRIQENTYSSLLNTLKTSNNPEECATAFMSKYEVSGEKPGDHGYENRRKRAREFLSLF